MLAVNGLNDFKQRREFIYGKIILVFRNLISLNEHQWR